MHKCWPYAQVVRIKGYAYLIKSQYLLFSKLIDILAEGLDRVDGDGVVN